MSTKSWSERSSARIAALGARLPRATRLVALAAGTGLAFAIWQFAIGWPSLGSALVSLGLDAERSGVAVALTGAALAGAVGGLLGRARLAWPLSAAWFVALYLLPAVLSGLPDPAPGQRLDVTGTVLAIVGLAGLAAAPGGLGAALGRGLRTAGRAASRIRWRDPIQASTATAALALLVLAAFGLWQAPGVFLYGPWQGMYQARLGMATRSLTFTYHSAILGGERRAVAILPPGYDSRGAVRYSVLYLLHGSPGSEQDWPRQGAGEIAAAAAQDGSAPPLVIVCPNGDGPRGGSHDSWADGYVPGDLLESSLLQDLVPAVESRFRVATDQRHRVVGGMSSGGYGAANMALRHPGVFGVALDLSGDVSPPASAFGGNEVERLANDPLILSVKPRPERASAFFVGWATQDPYAAENRQLAAQLRASRYLVRTNVARGGHQWSAWRALLSDGLTELGYLIGRPVPA